MTNLKLFADILEENENKLENMKLCQSCGGLCCKHSGCSYLPFDIEMTEEGIKKQIDLGDTSITTAVYFGTEGTRAYNFPILSLRSRNRKRGPIDLISEKVRCAALTNNGCKFSKDERPSGALSLIPGPGGLYGNKETACRSLFEEYHHEILDSWMPYQNELVHVVEIETGVPFEIEYKRQLLVAYNKIQKDIVEGYQLSDSSHELLETFQYMNMATIHTDFNKDTRSSYLETPKMRTYFRPYRMKQK